MSIGKREDRIDRRDGPSETDRSVGRLTDGTVPVSVGRDDANIHPDSRIPAPPTPSPRSPEPTIVPDGSTIDLPITTEARFHAARYELLERAPANDVALEGGWNHRCDDDHRPDCAVEISTVAKPVVD